MDEWKPIEGSNGPKCLGSTKLANQSEPISTTKQPAAAAVTGSRLDQQPDKPHAIAPATTVAIAAAVAVAAKLGSVWIVR